MSLATTRYAAVTTDIGMGIPMRDGTTLSADCYRPATPGRWPVVLLRTPYDRRLGAASGQQVHAVRLAACGYAVVIQDVRGRGESEGAFTPFVDDASDGYDTIDWLAQQPWSTGAVGLVGSSYAGLTQTLAVRERHPAVRAWFPAFTTLDVREGWVYEGDAFCLGFDLSWVIGLALGDRRTVDPEPLFAAMGNWAESVRQPLDRLIRLLDTPAGEVFAEWLACRDDEPYWAAMSGRGVGEAAVPSAQIGGWFDLFNTGTFDLHDELAGDPMHRLIVGPWDHSPMPLGPGSGESHFGVQAAFDLVGAQRRWFDWLLRDESEPPWPRARVFVTGWNRWEAWDAWPPPAVREPWHLHPGASLSQATPNPGACRFATDAANPTPTAGGRLCCAPYLLRPGQFDQSARSSREDVLTFVSDPLERDMLVAGPLEASVWSTSSLPVADIHVTISDLQPDGRAMYLADGIRRRFDLTGEPQRFAVRLGHIGHAFRAGHRIQVDISGMSFPRFDRAHETGAAERSLLCGGDMGSSITLSVVDY
jgi:uncharacterized protein